MRHLLKEIGKNVSGSGQLIIKEDMYKIEEYDVGKKVGMSFIPGAGGILSDTGQSNGRRRADID